MSSSTAAAACPGDGILLAYLDGAQGADARRSTGAHVGDCARCAGRLDELRSMDRRVGAWLERHDPPPPPTHAYDLEPAGSSRGTWRRWALAAGIVATIGVVAGPARGWVLDTLGLAPDEPPASQVVPSDQAATSTGFVPSGTELALTFVGTATGRLVVRQSPDSLVTLLAPRSEIEMVVRPEGLEIVDPTGAGGDYVLLVPASLERLRVRRPDMPTLLLAMPPGPDGRTVELARARAR